MNTVAHQFRKDILHFRIPLLLWLLSYALIIGCLVGKPDNVPPAPWWSVTLVSLFVIHAILTLALSAGVVLEDPPKGTTAFWLTRPLSRRVIALEKLCFLAAIAFVPVLCDLTIMTANGATLRMVAFAAMDKALLHAPWVAGIAAFAILAENYGQWAIRAILIMIGSGLAMAIWMVVSPIKAFSAGAANQQNLSALLASRATAAEIVVLVLGVGIVAWRYLRRHARFAVPLVAAACLASMLTVAYWKWNFLPGRAQAVPEVQSPAKLTFKAIGLKNDLEGGLFGTVEAVSDEKGDVIVPVSISEIRLRWSDGNISFLTAVARLGLVPGAAEAPTSLAKAISPIRVIDLPEKINQSTALNIDRSIRSRLGLETARLDGTIQADVRRCEICGELPLKEGSTMALDRSELTVRTLGTSDSGIIIGLREVAYYSPLEGSPSFATTVLYQVYQAAGPPPAGRAAITAVSMSRNPIQPLSSNPIYLLTNRRLNEAYLASYVPAPRTSNRGGLVITDHDFQFADKGITPSWMKDATLLVVRVVTIGRTTVPVSAASVGGYQQPR